MDGHFSSSTLIDNTVVSESTRTLTDINSKKHRNGKVDTCVSREQNPARDIWGDGKSSYHTNSHMLTSEPASSEKPVCNQPPLTNMLCPGFSLNPLFFTEDDFDDTF